MLIGAALLVALCAVYVVWSYAAWLREFDRNPRRFSRHNVHCPSHGGALPRPAIVAGRRTACDRVCGAVCPVSGRAAALDVDHVHFTRFRDFMWACAVLAPCGAAAFTYGILEHTARSWLRRAGLLFVRHPPCDVAQLAGTLVLESVGLAPGFVGLERDTVNKCCLASFRWKNLLLFDNTGTISTGCELRVTINLTTKKMVDASIDGSAINASEAVIVLSYLTVGAGARRASRAQSALLRRPHTPPHCPTTTCCRARALVIVVHGLRTTLARSPHHRPRVRQLWRGPR